MVKEEQLLEQRELRDQLVSRVDILDKVKQLLLMPDIKRATIKQVSEYYKVSDRWIKELLESNREEFIEDGYKVWKAEDFNNEESFPIKNLLISKGKFSIEFSNNQVETFSPRGVALFPRRAILRIGMLLQNSSVAKRVRTALLDIEEKTTGETKIADINEEQKLALSLGMAQASGDLTAITIATGNLMAFKNRHITKLENDNQILKQDNKALAGEILEWEDRSKINFAIRKLSMLIHRPVGYLWNDLYKELKYKHHIDIKLRGDRPYIEHVKEKEWGNVIKSFSAICETNNVSPSDILNNLDEGGLD